MATVNETVRESILCYPSLFSDRVSVLSYILCVMGNGFEWQDGEIVERNKSEYWSVELDNDHYQDGELDEVIREFLQGVKIERQKNALEVISTVEERVFSESKDCSIYPQTPHALLMSIPKNVTPDWAEACNSMKVLAKAEGWAF